MPRPARPVAAVREELRTVERYLAEVPPHSGSGLRDELQARAAELRRELARPSPQSSSEPSTDTNDSISPG